MGGGQRRRAQNNGCRSQHETESLPAWAGQEAASLDCTELSFISDLLLVFASRGTEIRRRFQSHLNRPFVAFLDPLACRRQTFATFFAGTCVFGLWKFIFPCLGGPARGVSSLLSLVCDSFHRSLVGPTRPDTVKYAMNLNGKHVEMHLEKNIDFLHEDYTETHYMSDGTPVVTKPEKMDLCYYQGKIINDRNSLVSMSTCDGLRGYFQTAEQSFLIEPLSEDSDGDHAVMKYEDVTNLPSVCGVTNTSWYLFAEGFPDFSSRKSKSRMSGQTMLQQKKYNEVFLVVDNRMYLKLDKNITKVRQKIFDIFNFVNVAYKPLNTFMALIGLEIWTQGDKIAVTTPSADTLNAFTTWRNDDLVKRNKHDNAHLITEIDFDGATVGLAFVGTLCTPQSTAVIQNHNTKAIAVGATLAHEMGHNLGMSHDNSSCTCGGDRSCIMSATLSYNIPKLFSTCSLAHYEQFLNTRNPECLLNKPQAQDLLQPPMCGNGLREVGEACDCGSVSIADASLMCRPIRDECDLSEYCTGSSVLCPEDVFSVNGLPCKNNTGYCYNGQCPKRGDQCIKMWGSGAVVAVDNCYSQNTKGKSYAYCTRPANEVYIGCLKQDVMCGKLFCDKGQATPNYGRSVMFTLMQGTCKATFYSNKDQDFGQVETGTKCGEAKVCSKNQCVSLNAAYNATNCTANCGANKVCNHKLQCICAPNWLPPDCVMPVSRSHSTNTSLPIGLAVVVLLGAVLVGVAIYCIKSRKNQRRFPEVSAYSSAKRIDCLTLNGVKVHEVVRPIRLHDLHKRQLEPNRPAAVKYTMTLGGKPMEMHLRRNDDFLPEGYTETHYTDNGTTVVTKPRELDLCYYHGKIANDSNSMVSISTCDGLRGYFQTAEQRYLIEPLDKDTDGDHAVLKYEDVTSTPAVCGVTNTTWESFDVPPYTRKSKSRASGPTMFQKPKYNEIILVVDSRMYNKMDKNDDNVRKRIFEIVNFVNAVYKPMNTFIALIGLIMWKDSDPIKVTEPAGQTLDKFTNWRNKELMRIQKHDNAHLITGIDFDSTTVGLAFIGTLCTGHSTGVIQDHNPRAIAVGATLAHEMGHNLGMNHDSSSCVCSEASCVMTAALSYNIPQLFSSCSINNFETYLNSRNPECLLNKPQSITLVQASVCGNGFREIGEDCDCGSVEECTNPCCNATTCTLTKGSMCAEGECCNDCKIADATLMCRPKRDECDLPEYCTGDSAFCPEDVFAVNGLQCRNGDSYCYKGQCPRLEDQCIKMWGSGAVVGGAFCYNQNTRGTYYAYCSWPIKGTYIGCQKQDVMCGKLFCEQGQDNPNYGRSVQFSNCKATFYDEPENDYGQVDTGTKCGNEKVCYQNQCINIEVAYKSTNCSAKCNGRGPIRPKGPPPPPPTKPSAPPMILHTDFRAAHQNDLAFCRTADLHEQELSGTLEANTGTHRAL
ncbi:Disintegrin and metalloproteinase domain-containing protein 28 [Bagarius yarrelli]|uniref:Disintegrin and metalloproteinase domain-containing protein 28 n=1 Tax=Bagarius yarrelli TaxID=175774 RepID=A0A556V0T5_BAGYA|nr:Disintegrin and metalloproteinase domain-containing protein 28 [Bagarius yarrelli]